MSRCKLAIFDLDGVLTETSEQHYKAWKVLADQLEIPFDRMLNEQLKGVSRMASLEIILKNGFKETAYTENEKMALAMNKNVTYKEMIADFNHENLFEGVKVLFRALKDKGIKIALASASNNGPTLLKRMDILDDFDLVMDPSKLKHGKANPEIFLIAARALGFKPSECIGFEDAVAGIKAIKSANMYAIGIGEKDILKEADIVYPHIKEVDIEAVLANMACMR